jgi:hypothetical protein
MIRVPDWIRNRLGDYYLYFADHKGSYVRLAYADHPTGPWAIYPPGLDHWNDEDFVVRGLLIVARDAIHCGADRPVAALPVWRITAVGDESNRLANRS